ncbi:MAG: helix-turn-helix transcriptional regulator [Candidatus Limnocylindrales bacterium]
MRSSPRCLHGHHARSVDRGKAAGLKAADSIGAEIRLARRGRGLSMVAIGREAHISASEVSRVERGEVSGVSLVLLSKLCAIVGLDLAARAYPGGAALRDARHVRLPEKLHAALHESLKWAMEVPLPGPGEQRAWDALIRGEGWRYGVECGLNPIDGQALIRRLQLKLKDGMVDGLILLLPDTRQTRLFRREFEDPLKQMFPVSGRIALERLANGLVPGGNALVTI